MLRAMSVVLLVLALAVGVQAQVMLNEFLYDTPSTDDPAIMYVEIYGPAGTSLAGYSLVGINGNGGTEYLTVALTGSIPVDGYYVVGGANVANVDQVVSADFQNAGGPSSADCDGLDLRNGATIVDHLCYGECGAGHVCTGEGGTNAPDPFPSGSTIRALARVPDHQDTDNNGTDWVSSDTLTPGTPNSGGVPCEPQYVTLADIRENDDQGVPALMDAFVVVRGIVNVDNYTLDSLTESTFYIQDDDAGVNIFRGPVPAGIMEGDCVEVSGWVDQYNGLTEIVSSGSGNCTFRVLESGTVDTVLPSLITTQSYLEGFEGMLVRMNDVTIVDGTWPSEGQWASLTITDGSGTIILRIDEDTDVDGTPAPQGPFSVVGILTQFDNAAPYDGGYQITPRYPVDILYSSAAEDEPNAGLAREFELAGAYPNPFNGSTQIRFEVGAARELELAIFDLLGREVARESLRGLTPGAHTYTWTPAGGSGLYLVRMTGASGTQTAKVMFLK